MPLQTMPITLGAGLDRATGAAAVQPAYAVDAENLYARDAKLALRPGLAGTGFPALPWGTDVCCVAPARVTGDVLFVLYDRTSRQLRIYRMSPQLGLIQPVGTDGIWGTLSPEAEWPVVLAAENDGRIFFAHDEPTLAYRLATVYVTPDIDNPLLPGSLDTLMADLDGDGVENEVYFRGVLAYLEYMCGWGWGSEQEGEEDRGDVLRLSQPAEPTRFLPESFALCGARKEPILAAIPVQGVLVIGKPTETYRLVGTSPADFRVELLDARYGPISSRSAIAVGDIGFWCSQDGPRVITRESTSPIAQALELISPLPTTLPPRGPDRTCFVVYDRERYTLEWLWPNLDDVTLRTPGFLLSRWEPSSPRWTFTVREQCISCAGEVIFAEALVTPTLDGYASNVVLTDVDVAADTRFRRLDVSWDNNEALGNETVQIFLRAVGSSWNIALSVPVGGSSQSASLDTVLPLTEYDVAIRYFRLGATGVGYESADPDQWTAPTEAGAKGNITTTSAAVAWTGGSFTGASNPITLTWASAQAGVPYLLEKNPGSGWVTLASEYVGTSYTYVIPTVELNTTVQFRLTARRGAIVGPTAGTYSILMDIVVPPPSWVTSTWSAANGAVTLVFTTQQGLSYEWQKSPDALAWAAVSSLPTATQTTHSTVYAPTTAEVTVGQLYFRVRARQGAYTSDWAVTAAVALTLNLPAPNITAVSLVLDPPNTPRPVLTVTRDAVGGDATYVELLVGINGGTPGNVGSTAPGNTTPQVRTLYISNPLPPNLTPITARVSARSRNNTLLILPSATSPEQTVTVSDPLIPPAVAMTPQAATLSQAQLTLSFSVESGDLSLWYASLTFIVEVSNNGGTSWSQLLQQSNVDGLPGGISYTPLANGTYIFRTRMRYGTYETSRTLTLTYTGAPFFWSGGTLGVPVLATSFSMVSNPSSLAAAARNTVTWGGVPSATGYDLERSTVSASGPWTLIASNTNIPNVQDAIPLLEAQGFTRYYRVRARAGTTVGDWSAVASQVSTFSPTITLVTTTYSPSGLPSYNYEFSWSPGVTAASRIYNPAGALQSQGRYTGMGNILALLPNSVDYTQLLLVDATTGLPLAYAAPLTWL